jgi:NitT/TauT family transport system ATP-binding protein
MAFSCQHLSKTYWTRGGLVPALQDISFRIRPEEFVCILGSSGCGKTTLLKLIAGLEEPTEGQVAFGHGVFNDRPRTAMVFQDHGLFPWMNVQDNVAFGLEMRGVPRAERLARAAEFIDLVGLTRFGHSFPHELSVGMRQRVGIARAFLVDPDVLLMDEPLGSLDAQTKLILQVELLRIWQDHRKVIVYVTHDIDEAILLGDRVFVMIGHPGRIAAEFRVPLDRPRALAFRDRPDIWELKEQIWSILESDVRARLEMRP